MNVETGIGHLQPRSPRYQRLPILDGFDWDVCLDPFPDGEWYCVVFRSVLHADASSELLTEFDNRAHSEALASGGLLLYFRGETDAEGGCLSLCLWADRESARTALTLPQHRAATALAGSMYAWFHVERYVIRKAIDGTITAEPWRASSGANYEVALDVASPSSAAQHVQLVLLP